MSADRAALAIDRLHARYVVDRPDLVEPLDDCLRRLATDALEDAVAGSALPAAEHVCVRRLDVAVRLDPTTGATAAARVWAGEILAALRKALAGAGPGRAPADADPDVLVYPRTLDALVDLVVSLGRADARRSWAWQQVGLLPGASVDDPAAATASALLAHPELAPAALVAAAAHGSIALSSAGWVVVAWAVQERVVGAPRGHRASDDDGADAAFASSPMPSPTAQRLVERVLAARVTRLLPRLLDRGSATAPDIPSADREALAQLAVLCTAPQAVRDASVVEAVARAMVGADPGSQGHDRQPRNQQQSSAKEPEHRGAPEPTAERVRGSSAEDSTHEPTLRTAAADMADATELGGLLFLIPLVTELDLPTETPRVGSPLSRREFGWVASRLAQQLSGTALDDPAVRILGGSLTEDEDEKAPPDDAEQAALDALAERVTDSLRERLRLTPEDDLDWLWRRRATVVAEPGWIEGEFALADVDVRVRVAGLDLDPGFVWWLGAVVRFRYA